MHIFLKKNSCFSDICKSNLEICLQIDVIVIAIYVHAFKIVRGHMGLLYLPTRGRVSSCSSCSSTSPTIVVNSEETNINITNKR